MEVEQYLEGLQSSERKHVWDAIGIKSNNALWAEQIISPIKLEHLMENEYIHQDHDEIAFVQNPDWENLIREVEESSEDREYDSDARQANEINVILN